MCESTVLTVFLPPTAESWPALGGNPLIGYAVEKSMSDMLPEDFRFYCDPCQHGFNNNTQYQEHMSRHIWCEHPGCKFTCRQDQRWKMDMHIETLHSRPDAPDLLDTAKYIQQRKKSFPTAETVKTKVEEWYLRSASGEVIPDERRRWLRQHGLRVKRRTRPLPPHEHHAQRSGKHAPDAVSVVDAPGGSANDCPSAVSEQKSTKGLRPPEEVHRRLIPEGPNGRLSRRQLVQLVRERYRDSRTVPKFYVCPRCGQKGHWVDDCPEKAKAGDACLPPTPTATQQVVACETVVEAPSTAKKEDDASDRSSSPSSSTDSTVDSQESDAEEKPTPAMETPLQHSLEEAADSVPHPAQLLAVPPAATTTRSAKTNQKNIPEQQAVRCIQRVHPPNLYRRMIETEVVAERGLLLQAIHFIVQSNYFQPQEREQE